MLSALTAPEILSVNGCDALPMRIVPFCAACNVMFLIDPIAVRSPVRIVFLPLTDPRSLLVLSWDNETDLPCWVVMVNTEEWFVPAVLMVARASLGPLSRIAWFFSVVLVKLSP